MIKAIGVQFLTGLKVYDFDPEEKKVSLRDYILVETAQGEEIGKVVYIEKEIDEKKISSPLKGIEKVLSDSDIEKLKEYRQRGQDALPKFREKVFKYGLQMKPVMVDFSLDGDKMIFYFSADGRVDFRELLKDLARTFKKQIKMKQIGSRDEAKIYGGFGMCGRPICCKSFLVTNASITMDMVRDQYETNMSASKVSGICGRLMCCIAFENGDKIGKKNQNKNKKK